MARIRPPNFSIIPVGLFDLFSILRNHPRILYYRERMSIEQ
jgi:hypothetical protein